ncbi:MAG: SRPBCC family protein [bacterium]|nr:SRPBCC family protein [bacterium]
MPRVEHAIEIHAAPDRVFAMVANNPERMPDWWESFELQQRVTPPPTEVGSVSRYVYNMMGVKIKGEHRVIDLKPGEYLLVQTTSGIEATFEFRFAPCASGGDPPHTQLTISVDYALPGAMLGKLLNRLTMEQKNERDLQHALLLLKALIESQVITPTPS